MASTNTQTKILLITALDEIPVVGGFIGGLLELLWPEDEVDVWEQIRARTEQLVSDRLDQDATQRLQRSLVGLKTILEEYKTATRERRDPHNLYANYAAVRTVFDQQLPLFQQASHRMVLLPLFVQAANLQLALLRDGYLHGPQAMGMGEQERADVKARIKELIGKHADWARTVVAEVLANRRVQGDGRNAAAQQMTIDVVDYLDLWPFYDPDSPKPGAGLLEREVYSSLIGVWNTWPSTPPGRGYGAPPPANARVTRIQAGAKVNNVLVESIVPWYDGQPGSRVGGNVAKAWSLDVDVSGHGPHGKLVALHVNSWFQNPDPGGEGVYDIAAHFQDGTLARTRMEPNIPAIVVPVPDDHYLSSVQAVAKYSDKNRGMLYDDQVRSIWFGFRFEPEVFKLAQVRARQLLA